MIEKFKEFSLNEDENLEMFKTNEVIISPYNPENILSFLNGFNIPNINLNEKKINSIIELIYCMKTLPNVIIWQKTLTNNIELYNALKMFMLEDFTLMLTKIPTLIGKKFEELEPYVKRYFKNLSVSVLRIETYNYLEEESLSHAFEK